MSGYVKWTCSGWRSQSALVKKVEKLPHDGASIAKVGNLLHVVDSHSERDLCSTVVWFKGKEAKGKIGGKAACGDGRPKRALHSVAYHRQSSQACAMSSSRPLGTVSSFTLLHRAGYR